MTPLYTQCTIGILARQACQAVTHSLSTLLDTAVCCGAVKYTKAAINI